MPVVNSCVRQLGPQIQIMLNGTPLRDGVEIPESDILCDNGVIILTVKGGLTLASELLTECRKYVESPNQP